jgi:hypothetical protein
LGYGPEYAVSFYSSKLGKSINSEVDLSKIQIKEVDVSIFKNKNEFEFKTPTGVNLTFKLLTHGDEKAIEKDIAALEKLNKETSYDITTRLRYMITSVNGDNTISALNKYINGMLAKDSRAFREYVKKITPDLDMKFTYTHEDGEVEEAPIGMSVNFFWPNNKS